MTVCGKITRYNQRRHSSDPFNIGPYWGGGRGGGGGGGGLSINQLWSIYCFIFALKNGVKNLITKDVRADQFVKNVGIG